MVRCLLSEAPSGSPRAAGLRRERSGVGVGADALPNVLGVERRIRASESNRLV